MAYGSTTFDGQAGVIKVTSGGSQVAVAEVRSFTIDQETATVESTVMGDTARSYLPSLTQFSGTADVFLRDDDAGQTVFETMGADPVTLEVYPSGETTGQKLAGNIIVTGHSITSNFDGMVEASITFQGVTALTKSATS